MKVSKYFSYESANSMKVGDELTTKPKIRLRFEAQSVIKFDLDMKVLLCLYRPFTQSVNALCTFSETLPQGGRGGRIFDTHFHNTTAAKKTAPKQADVLWR